MQEMQETWVQSLGREDPLEEEVAPRSNILAWEIPRAEEPGGLQSMGSPRAKTTSNLVLFPLLPTHSSCLHSANYQPLLFLGDVCSCFSTVMDLSYPENQCLRHCAD